MLTASVAWMSNWSAAAGGFYHTVALKKDGSLWAWGENAYGELGLGNTVNKNVPTRVGSAKDWAAVVSGSYHTLALKKAGTLWGWG